MIIGMRRLWNLYVVRRVGLSMNLVITIMCLFVDRFEVVLILLVLLVMERLYCFLLVRRLKVCRMKFGATGKPRRRRTLMVEKMRNVEFLCLRLNIRLRVLLI